MIDISSKHLLKKTDQFYKRTFYKLPDKYASKLLRLSNTTKNTVTAKRHLRRHYD